MASLPSHPAFILPPHSHHRFLQRAAVARKLSADAVQARNITKALSDASVMLLPALTTQLIAQAALYIMCCVAMVLACLIAVVRLKKLSAGLQESQKFAQRHVQSIANERKVGQVKELQRLNADIDESSTSFGEAASLLSCTAF